MNTKVKTVIERGTQPLFLLIIACVFALFAVQGLRQNYKEMTRLREAVNVADQQNGDVEKALQDLRRHVHGHMNTNLVSGANAIRPPIQLKYRYERLIAADQERVKQLNDQVTRNAEAVCAGQFPAGGFNAPRVACIQDYVATHATKSADIADDLYKFDFVSPKWSPDLAGWSIVFSAIFFIWFVLQVVVRRLLRK